jgi:hypothetical protein
MDTWSAYGIHQPASNRECGEGIATLDVQQRNNIKPAHSQILNPDVAVATLPLGSRLLEAPGRL